jgi:hypothetical protein
MSGPIVRKYGFPNHDNIFGSRPLEHGVDEEPTSAEQTEEPTSTESPKKTTAKKKSTKPKKS